MSQRTVEGEKCYPNGRSKEEDSKSGSLLEKEKSKPKSEGSKPKRGNLTQMTEQRAPKSLNLEAVALVSSVTDNSLKANNPAKDGKQESILESPTTPVGSNHSDSRPVKSHQVDERSQKCEEIDLNILKSDSKSGSPSKETKSSAKSKKSKPKKGKIDNHQASSSHDFTIASVSDSGEVDALKEKKGVEDDLNKSVIKKIPTASTLIESKTSPSEDNSLSEEKKPQAKPKKSKAKRDKNIQMADQGASGSINKKNAVPGCEKGKEDNKSVKDGINQQKLLFRSPNTLVESNPDEAKPVTSFSDDAASLIKKLSKQCENLNLSNPKTDSMFKEIDSNTKSNSKSKKNNKVKRKIIRMTDEQAPSTSNSVAFDSQLIESSSTSAGPNPVASCVNSETAQIVVLSQQCEALNLNGPKSDLKSSSDFKETKANSKMIQKADGQAPSSSINNSDPTSESTKEKDDDLKYNKHSAENALVRLGSNFPDTIPFRPKMKSGRIGKKMKFLTNFFRLSTTDDTAYRYHINFSRPNNEDAVAEEREIGPRFRRVTKMMHQRLLQGFVHTVGQDLFIGTIYCFDGDHVMITNRQLNIRDEGQEFEFPFAETGQRDLERYLIKIVPVQSGSIEVNLVDLNLSESNRNALQMLDIITKKEAFENLIVYKSKIFFPESLPIFPRIGIQNGLFEIAFGYHQSTRICQGGLMQNIDRATAILFRGGPLIDRIGDLIGRENLNRPAGQHLEMLREFHSLKVQTNHLGSPRTYTIRSFSNTPCNRTYFTVATVRISVADYFRDTHCINLRYPNLPCVEYSPRKYLPIEICKLIPHQRYQRKLREDLIRELTSHSTRQRPRERLQLSSHSARAISQQNALQHFGIELNPVPVEVDGRIIPSPLLKYSNVARFEVPKQLGDWNMAQPVMKKFLKSPALERWIMIAVHTKRSINGHVAKSLFDKLVETGNRVGINIARPCQPFQRFNPSELRNNFEKFLKLDLQLIVCIANERSDIYNEIKSLGDCLIGVPTQVINDKNYNPRNARLQKIFTDAYLFNLLLKINKKIGGDNVGLSENPNLLQNKTMVVGIDVNHPSPGDDSPSIAAVVGSLDRYFSNYFTEIRINNSRIEFVEVASMMTPILEEFRSKNSNYPDKIIVYRDGVAEGMFADVVYREIKPLSEYLSTLGRNPPKLTYIIVQKRHSTRLFPADERSSTRSGNVPPGSVVDTDICHYKWFDFYLCSQNSFLGTARPNKYTVLFDQTIQTDSYADDLQQATYHLCYLFARATKSISDPAPARLAHHAAARGKTYLLHILSREFELRNNTTELTRRISFNRQLRNKLFYI